MRPAPPGLLRLAGEWRGRSDAWPALPAGLTSGDTVSVDAQALGSWDVALAARLWELAQVLRERGVPFDLHSLQAAATTAQRGAAGHQGLYEVVALASPQHGALEDDARPAATAQAAPRPRRRIPMPPRTSEAVVTVAFFGEVLLAFGRWLSGRAIVRGAEVLHQLDETGPRSLPIVAMTCALVGLMLAYMGGAQLGRIGAYNYLADIVAVGMVREVAALMTGVILAGRIGSAFAAQLATMKAGEEIDALRVLGVEPVAHLVVPRLAALLLMAPALYACGVTAGIVAGWPAASGSYGVASVEYFHQSARAIDFTHLVVGLFKTMLYVALVALAGCREGLHAGRSAQAVGAATTTAVVKGLVWLVVAACGTTVAFSILEI
ncbi:MAG: ABC transporter permease [Rubrivivax sp.]